LDTKPFLQSIEPLVRGQFSFPRWQRWLERIGILPSSDPCPSVQGMASPKKLRLLQLAGAALPRDGSELYFEVGTFQGKSLIAAMRGHAHARAVACDNFSLFDDPHEPRNQKALEANLRDYGLEHRVTFFNRDFRDVIQDWPSLGLPPVGCYFYDGAHDEDSQYRGIRDAEPLLADEALVLVDDWRFAPDSDSRAEAGTRRAMAACPRTSRPAQRRLGTMVERPRRARVQKKARPNRIRQPVTARPKDPACP